MDETDKIRKTYLMFAEMCDALRLIPRSIVIVYGYVMWDAFIWIKSLETISNQHVAILTAIFGLAGVIFGFYSKTSRSWLQPFISWKKSQTPITSIKNEKQPETTHNTS